MRQCARQLAAAESNDGETRLQLPALWLVGWDQHSPADPPQTSEFCTKTCPITHQIPPPPFRRFTTHRFCPSPPNRFFFSAWRGGWVALNLERLEKEDGACLGRSSRIDEPTRLQTWTNPCSWCWIFSVFLYGGLLSKWPSRTVPVPVWYITSSPPSHPKECRLVDFVSRSEE